MEENLIFYGVLMILPVISSGVPYEQLFRSDYTFDAKAGGWLKFHRVPLRWEQAHLVCHEEGAVLASPSDKNIAKALTSLMIEHGVTTTPIFTGISSINFNSVQKFVEGTSVTNTFLLSQTSESCVGMNADGATADVSCVDFHPFACFLKKEINVTTECGTTDTEYVFDNRTGSCYKVYRDQHKWDEASLICAERGGHLAVINSQAEAEVIWELAKDSSSKVAVLIGFYSNHKQTSLVDEQRIWTTVQGQSLEEAGYSRWFKDEPNSVDENCGSVIFTGSKKDGILNDAPCQMDLMFICENKPNIETMPELLAQQTEENKQQTKNNKQQTENNKQQTEENKQQTEENKQKTENNKQQTENNKQQTVENKQQTEENKQQTEENKQQTADNKQQNEENKQQTAENKQQTEENKQQTEENKQQTEENKQQTEENKQQTEENKQQTADNKQQNEENKQQTAENKQQTEKNKQQTEDNKQKTEENKQQTENNKQQTAENKQQTEENKQQTEENKQQTEENNSTAELEVTTAKEVVCEEVLECNTQDKEYVVSNQTGSCYKVHKIGRHWNQARDICRGEGGHLAIINSDEEAGVLWELARKNWHPLAMSIGFREHHYSFYNGRVWKTVQGHSLEEAGYARWYRGEPNSLDENCGSISFHGPKNEGILNDAPCNMDLLFICEMESTTTTHKCFN